MHEQRGSLKHHHRLGKKYLESSPVEKDMGVLVDEKLNVSQQYALATQKSNCILGCIKSRVASRARVVILPFYSVLKSPGYGVAQERPGPAVGLEQNHKNDQRYEGMEYLSYEDRLRIDLGKEEIFPVCVR